MPQSYNAVLQTRTTIGTADTWIPVSIPIGARYPLLAVEDSSVSFRVSTDNSVDPASQGLFVPAAGSYQHEGVNTDTLTLYVSASGTTTAIVVYTQD